MNFIHQVLKSKNDKMSSCGYNSEFIVESSKSYPDFESLMNSKEKKGMLETVEIVKIDKIVKAVLEKDSIFILYLNENGKKRNFSFKVEPELLDGVFKDIQEMRGFKVYDILENKRNILLLNLFLYSFFSGLIALVAYIVGEREHGLMTGAPSRRKGLYELVMGIGDFIGSSKLYIISLLVFLYSVYALYKRYKNPRSHKTIQA